MRGAHRTFFLDNTVTGLSEEYVRPQDNGCRTGVRWLSLTDADGKGVRFSASKPLFVQALHFAREDLEFARHRRGEPRVRATRNAPERVSAMGSPLPSTFLRRLGAAGWQMASVRSPYGRSERSRRAS